MVSGEGRPVVRDIWHAREQSAADLDADLTAAGGHGRGRACKAMRHVGFGGEAEPVDEDLRAAWRSRLQREGKLRPDGQSLATLLPERTDRNP